MQTMKPAIVAIVALAIASPATTPTVDAMQDATPTTTYSCENVSTSETAGTPMAATGDMSMGDGTPMSGMDHMAMEPDQMYIDMMIPHHGSIIAMAEAALPRLADDRLREIARTIVDTQSAEIVELRGHRDELFGEADPMPMDEGMMAAMNQMMPEMGDMETMAALMDADALVAALCAAEDADLAFIDLTIPHHQMAIDASEVVLEQGLHLEIQEVAQQVIEAQQREIEELQEIRESLTGAATPASS